MKWFIGTKVKVKEGSGLDSGKIGKIVARFEVKTNSQGIPTNVQGAYKPVDWRREVAIQLDDTGEIITMFKSHIVEIRDDRDIIIKTNEKGMQEFDETLMQETTFHEALAKEGDFFRKTVVF